MYLITNGKLITGDGALPYIEHGAVAVNGGRIVEVGESSKLNEKYAQFERIDANGGLIMPGLIDLHAHSRRMLFIGNNLPPFTPDESFKCYKEYCLPIHRLIKLEHCTAAAYAFSLRCIRNGVTTVFDHHSSPECAFGSLETIATANRECGVRSCLSFEVNDMFGSRRLQSEIIENAEFIEYCNSLNSELIRPLFGLSSSFTLSDDTLRRCIEANTHHVGFHLHAGESQCDIFSCLKDHCVRPIKRFESEGVLFDGSLIAGGVCFNDEDLAIIEKSGCAVAMTPLSGSILGGKRTNFIGCFKQLTRLGIGSDSVSSDMFEVARSTLLAERVNRSSPYIPIEEAADTLFVRNADIASKIFGVTLGKLVAGAAADIIIMAYSPCCQITPQNLNRVLLGELHSSLCRMTMVNGRILMRGGEIVTVDEEACMHHIREAINSLL